MEVAGNMVGSVVPTTQAHLRLRPIDATGVSLDGGLLGERQRTNREVTLLRGAEELEHAGTLENFRIASGRATGERRGMVFSDSDVYKWLEALAWELGRKPSAELQRLATETIELVAATQEPDGYLNTYCQVVDPAWRWSDLRMGHELYCAGHLIQAGIAFARATGDETLLGVARRFADLLDDEFRGGPQRGTDGHPEIETALVELYRFTSDHRYLELSETLIGRRGFGLFTGGRFSPRYYQDEEPVRGSRTIVGHAVRALYLAAGVTDIYIETGDDELLATLLAQWDDLVSSKTYLTGGVGSRHRDESIGDAHELPPDRAYCETCAAIASIMWNWRLLLVTGESRFADMIERTLYNGFLSGVSIDGRSFFYVNPLQSRGGHARAAWDPVACCPPNIMRLLASINQYVATTSRAGIEIHQYAPALIRTTGSDGEPVELRVETEYPWSGRVCVEVVASGAADWTLSLRVPQWSRGATLDGEPVAPGAARLTRSWRPGDRVVLDLDVAPRLTAPNPRIDAVRGCLAVERGPLVYCLEGRDQPSSPDLADIAVEARTALRDSGEATGLAGMPAIAADGFVSSVDGWARAEYRDVRDVPAGRAEAPTALLAITYFAWGNRGDGAMRVWIPAAGANGAGD